MWKVMCHLSARCFKPDHNNSEWNRNILSASLWNTVTLVPSRRALPPLARSRWRRKRKTPGVIPDWDCKANVQPSRYSLDVTITKMAKVSLFLHSLKSSRWTEVHRYSDSTSAPSTPCSINQHCASSPGQGHGWIYTWSPAGPCWQISERWKENSKACKGEVPHLA